MDFIKHKLRLFYTISQRVSYSLAIFVMNYNSFFLIVVLLLFSPQLIISQIVDSCVIDDSQNIKAKLSGNISRSFEVISCDDLGIDSLEAGYNLKLNIRDAKNCSSIIVSLGYRQFDNRMDENFYGVSYYNQLDLGNELLVGKKYRISLRVFIEQVTLDDTLFLYNSGLILSNERVKFQEDNMIETSNILPFERVHTGQWITKDWIVQPSCNINNVTLGSFRNGNWPTSIYYEGSRSFLVDSYQIELLDDSYVGDIINYNCFNVEHRNKPLSNSEPIQFLYETGMFNLNNHQQSILDSLSIKLKANPYLIIGIEGYADSKGIMNKLLSERRVSTIKSYLEEIHGIPSIRILEFPKGDAEAKLSNGENSSDQSYRKTIVYISELKAANVIYRKIINSTQLNESKMWLKKWLLLSSLKEKITLYFNSCFTLQTSIELKPIILKSILADYKEMKIPQHCLLLDSLIFEDQKLITFNHDVQKLYGYDRNDSKNLFRGCSDFLIELHDSLHMEQHNVTASALKDYIDLYGWPDYHTYGTNRLTEMSLIFVHQSDLNKLIESSEFLLPFCEKGLAPWMTYALIKDKISKLKNEPQLYGTQWELINDNNLIIYKHVQDEVLKNARSRLGLPMIDLNKSLKLNK